MDDCRFFFYNFHMIFFFIFILTVWLFCGVLLFFLNFLMYFVAISLVFRVCYISDVIYCLSTFLIQKKLYKKKLNKIKYFHKYLLMFPFFSKFTQTYIFWHFNIFFSCDVGYKGSYELGIDYVANIEQIQFWENKKIL